MRSPAQHVSDLRCSHLHRQPPLPLHNGREVNVMASDYQSNILNVSFMLGVTAVTLLETGDGVAHIRVNAPGAMK